MGEYAGRIESPLSYESAFSQLARAVVLNEIGGSAFLPFSGIDDWGWKWDVLNKSLLPIDGIHGRFFGPRMPRETGKILNGRFCSASLRICLRVALVPSLEQSELRMLFGSVHALRGMSGLQEYTKVLMEIDTADDQSEDFAYVDPSASSQGLPARISTHEWSGRYMRQSWRSAATEKSSTEPCSMPSEPSCPYQCGAIRLV
ncbi:hypothetical protein SAMN05444172_2248 [Burkholderia sp. GAS332]|nr:hypothetical protein SAMN05444172_2248 [Burkholderia sp. GAS332]